MDKLLEIKNLSVGLFTAYGFVHGVRDVSLDVFEGETVGIVGESGCGKTLTAKSVLGLHNEERTELGGEIIFTKKNGEKADILKLGRRELRKLRGSEISMVLQDPPLSLSPIISVGKQLEDVIIANRGVSRKEAESVAIELLNDVGIDRPEMRLKSLPGELSGGQLQRICIAAAISSNPRLLIADEPTTALDSVTQAQILGLLKSLSEQRKMAVLIVTHNFSVVKRLCDRVYVMYAGFVAESGSVAEVIKNPLHCYTRDLLRSIPDGTKKRLEAVSGTLPDVYSEIKGCAYAPRCKNACASCFEKTEPRTEGGRTSLCLAGRCGA